MKQNITVHHYARNNDIEKDFLNSLTKRKIDEKFSYIGKRQANAWINLSNSVEYEYYRDSKNLLQDHVENFVSDITTDVNIIVLGSGDALKEKIVVNHLREKHRVNLFFIDISREMLNVAIKNTEDSDVLKEVFIADLANFTDIKNICHDIKKRYNPTNFFTLLGNTLGSYPQAMILKTIRNAMTPGDKILIDVHIEKDVSATEKMLQENRYNPTYVEKTMATLSEAGIDETDGEIQVELYKNENFPEINTVNHYFCFKRNKIVTYNGESFYFGKEERILVSYSNQYTLEFLENILTSNGLRIVKQANDNNRKCCQVLCELA